MLYFLRSVCFFIFFSHFDVSANQKGTEIHIVYHVATINNWQEIVREQLHRINKSGLVDVCDSFTMTIVGYEIQKVREIVSEMGLATNVTIIHSSDNVECYEFPGVEKVRQIAFDEPNAKILYFHNKGVTRYQTPMQEPVNLWRKYMEYFLIDQWKFATETLNDFDACGVDLTSNVVQFFAGNFWWANGSYIQTCYLDYSNRWGPEAFIGTGCFNTPNLFSFHQSGENAKLKNFITYESHPEFFHNRPGERTFQRILNLYCFPYLPEYYVKEN